MNGDVCYELIKEARYRVRPCFVVYDDGRLYILSAVAPFAKLGPRNAIIARHGTRDMLARFGRTRGKVKDKQALEPDADVVYVLAVGPVLSSVNCPSRGTHAMCSGQVTISLRAKRWMMTSKASEISNLRL